MRSFPVYFIGCVACTWCYLSPLPSCHCSFSRQSHATRTARHLQRVENATRNFSTKQLQRSKPGGLYSTIGRSKVGLIETDIDDLTATVTSRTEVLAATKRATVVQSLASHGDGVLAGLLGQKTTTLPTVNPACFHDPLGSREGTPGSPKRSRPNHHAAEQRGKTGSSSGRGLVATVSATAAAGAGAGAAAPEEGLELSKRVRILGADEDQHRENLADNLRRLRALLGASESQSELRRAGTPSLFSVRELRAIGAAKRQRKRPNTGGVTEDEPAGQKGTKTQGGSGDPAGVQLPTGSEAKAAEQGGAAAELAGGGNALLRNLAKALFSSMQCRIQDEFLRLAFEKWKVRNCNSPRDEAGVECTLVRASFVLAVVALIEFCSPTTICTVHRGMPSNSLVQG